jgi:hypothetical protein
MADKKPMGKNHADYEGNLVTGVPFTRTKISSDAYSQTIGAGDVGNYSETPDDAMPSPGLDMPVPSTRGADKGKH